MLNKSLLKTLGPGILFASTCIGVSHLVQSTRAGAVYGFDLVWAIALANLFKYPFFEFASRYANATGTSIIDGYKRLGKGILWLYLIITVATMFFVCAVVTVVTGGFMDNLFSITPKIANLGVPYPYLAAPLLVLVVCGGILFAGKYKLLDSMIKVIGAILLISTVLAFILALLNGAKGDVEFRVVNLEEALPIGFLIALMGWMPTALDLSSWNSLWTVARIKQTGYHPKLKETLFDFNFGYLSSAVLALFFVTLGAYLMYGTGDVLPKGPGPFGSASPVPNIK
jgi:Mn2+/Fe2+ NRAMP family transporter